MRPVIHSTKHYVQMSRFTIGAAARINQDLIIAVESTTANAVDEVEEGAIVKAVYVEMWLLDSGAAGSAVVTLTKATAGSLGPSFGEMNALGTYDEKKNVLFTFQGLTPNDGIAQPFNIMRGWFKIPKSKQRFGLGDRLVLSFGNNSAQDLFGCGFSTYKEYT